MSVSATAVQQPSLPASLAGHSESLDQEAQQSIPPESGQYQVQNHVCTPPFLPPRSVFACCPLPTVLTRTTALHCAALRYTAPLPHTSVHFSAHSLPFPLCPASLVVPLPEQTRGLAPPLLSLQGFLRPCGQASQPTSTAHSHSHLFPPIPPVRLSLLRPSPALDAAGAARCICTCAGHPPIPLASCHWPVRFILVPRVRPVT